MQPEWCEDGMPLIIPRESAPCSVSRCLPPGSGEGVIVPELPEVETVVRDLRPHLTGRRLTSVQVGSQPLRRRWLAEWESRLVGRRVREVGRRGKWILIHLQGELHLVIHLGMTGQLC